MPEPSESDRTLLQHIVDLTRERGGRPPTLAEIAERAGLTSAARGNIQRQLSRLRPTYVDWASESRSIHVTDAGLALLNLQPVSNTRIDLPISDAILPLLARGLIDMDRQVQATGSLRVPYPEAWQRALNMLAVAYFERGLASPSDTIEAIRWCARPLGEWNVRWSNPRAVRDERLVEDGHPTTFCEELAAGLPRRGAELELSERIMVRVRERARSRRAQTAYVDFRRFLIEQPCVTQDRLLRAALSPQFTIFEGWINDVYEPVPLACIESGIVQRCGHCGWTLERRNGRLHCGHERCAALTHDFTRGRREEPFDERNPLFRVRPAIRQFVVAPGVYEVHVWRQLERLGVATELWPGYDTFDLAVTFGDGDFWAVDIKDWRYAHLLAPRLTPFDTIEGLRWTRALYVIPDARADEDPEYLPFLRSATAGQSFEVLTIKQLVAAVTTKVQS